MKQVRRIFEVAAILVLAIVAASCGSSTTTDNATPILSNVSPASVTEGSPAFQIDVVALNAISTSVVMWNQTNLTTSLNKTTGDLVATVPTKLVAHAGSAELTVFNPSPGGGQSNSLTFYIDPPNNPAPKLTSVSPSSIAMGETAFGITLTGTGFVSSSVVSWNGSPRSTAFESTTELKATVLAGDIAAAGKARITVVNPTPGGGVSNAVTFTVTDPTSHAATHAAVAGSGGEVDGKAVQVSVSAAEGAADGVSGAPRVDASGRYVAFESRARNLVGRAGASGEVFVRDMCLGAGAGCEARTAAVDVAADGGEPDAPAARGLAISAGGRYVAFASRADNLLAASDGEAGLPSTSSGRATSGGSAQIYLRDTCMRVEAGTKCQPKTMLISGAEGSREVGADGASEFPSISADGRYVSFASTADNLVAGVSSAYSQIYVRDTCVGAPAAERCVARTALVSVGARGAAGKGASVQSSISADGRYVAYDSAAVDMMGGVQNGTANVYVRDTCAGASVACTTETTLVSANVFGAAGDGASFEPAVSGGGRYVVFVTRADDIGAEFESRAIESARGTQRIVLRDTCMGTGAGCKASSKVIWDGAEGAAHAPAISGDGRAVSFVSEAGSAGALRTYLWKACAAGESACESKPILLAASSAGDGAALPEGNSRFAAPLSAEAGVVVIFSVEAPPQAVEMAKLSGKGDVFLIELP